MSFFALLLFPGFFAFPSPASAAPKAMEAGAAKRKLVQSATAKRSAKDLSRFEQTIVFSAGDQVSVTVMDERFVPVHTFNFTSEKTGPRRVQLWEGKAADGSEAPAGIYLAVVSVRQSDGKLLTHSFRLEWK